MKLFLLAVVACTSIACANVRIVDDDDGDGGSSSSSSSIGGDATGTGGSAGGPQIISCQSGELTRVGDLEEVPLGEADEHLYPRLVQLASGGVVLVVSARPLDGSFAHSPALSVLEPWGAWPPSIEAPALLPYGNKGWTEAGAVDGHAYLMTSTLDGTYLLPTLPDDPDDAVLIASEPVEYIHFAPRSEDTYLLRTDGSNSDVLTTAWPSGATESLPASCAESDFADAVAVPGGFLVAERFATLEGGGCPSSSVDLLITRYSVAAGGELVREVAQTIPVGSFGDGRLVERSDGAWLLIESDVAGDIPFSARRLDVNGLTASEPIELGQQAGVSGVDRFSDGFAIARFNPDTEYGLSIELFDADGALRQTAAFADSPIFIGGAAQLLPSPDGSSLLVAFFGTDSAGEYRAMLTRFDCAAL